MANLVVNKQKPKNKPVSVYIDALNKRVGIKRIEDPKKLHEILDSGFISEQLDAIDDDLFESLLQPVASLNESLDESLDMSLSGTKDRTKDASFSFATSRVSTLVLQADIVFGVLGSNTASKKGSADLLKDLLAADDVAAAIDELYKAVLMVNPGLSPTEAITLAPRPLSLPDFMTPEYINSIFNVSPYWLLTLSGIDLRDINLFDDIDDPTDVSVLLDGIGGADVIVGTDGIYELLVGPENTEHMAAGAKGPIANQDLDIHSFEAVLNSKIIGQSHAVQAIEEVSKRYLSGFRDTSKPIGVLVFAGSTGLGKTLLAKETANLLFGPDKFGRIDAATLSNENDVWKLLGAPPGYAGYPSGRNGDPKDHDPALIYRAMENKQDGAVLLIDEVEKAAPEIWDQFLTVFDEGYLTTSVGNHIDLTNTLIIMTTNAGSAEISADDNKSPIGFAPHQKSHTERSERDKKYVMKFLSSYMKPELIGRIDDIITFRPFQESDLEAIVDIEIEKVQSILGPKVKDLTLSKNIKQYIASRAYGSKQNARNVNRYVDNYIMNALVHAKLDPNNRLNDLLDKYPVHVDTNETCDIITVECNNTSIEYEPREIS